MPFITETWGISLKRPKKNNLYTVSRAEWWKTATPPALNIQYLMRLTLHLLPIPILLICLLACRREDPVPCMGPGCDQDTMGRLELKWVTPLNPDTSWGNPYLILTDHGLVVSHYAAQKSAVKLFDINGGQRIWHWTDLDVDHYTTTEYHRGEQKIVVQNRTRMASIDLASGQTYRRYVQEQDRTGNPFGHILGDHYYYTWRDVQDTVAKLLRTHITDFQTWDTVYTVRRSETDGSRPNIQSYNLWVDPETGDSVLVFQHRMSSPNRVDVVAWNMTRRRVEWRHDNLEPLGNSSLLQVLVLGDRLYFQGGATLYCMDMRTGEIRWQFRHPSNANALLYHRILYAADEDLVILKDDDDILYAFRPETGQVAWQRREAGQSSVGAGSPVYHRGIIYYCTFARLYAVRAATGQVIWEERSNLHWQSQFSGELAVDSERGLLYACDQHYVMAIRLPE